MRISVNAIIVGETGTGKTALAEILRDYFYQNKIIDKPKLTMVDAVDYQRFVDKWDENIKKAKNGILFFDNVQKLLPDKYSNQVNPLDKLFVEMDKWDDNPVVITDIATAVQLVQDLCFDLLNLSLMLPDFFQVLLYAVLKFFQRFLPI